VTGFDRLHPSIQHHVVNSLGWPALRPLQEATIGPILAGEHAVLLAPTAGGKTEAAAFPVLTRVASERWRPVSVLYVCPLRALLNNLLPRLERYAAYTGHRVGLWHGDVGQSERARMVADPPDVLLTTPESIEAMLISAHLDSGWMLGRVRTVVIDEVHAFAGDDRGWHLLAVLARLQRLAGHQIQRIGLSATVGNPAGLLDWLRTGVGGPGSVVNPAVVDSVVPDVTIDHVGGLANAAEVISRLHRGEKRLVFVDSRLRAEKLTSELRARSVDTYVAHGSLGRDERRRAEAAFAEGSDCVIVATSALELGIDVGDLDRVIQIDAPGTVSSFLQRLGRTGRRAGTSRNTLFLTTEPEALWQAAGLTRLWSAGFVEPVEAPALPLHLFVHQLLALTLQERQIGRDLWPEWLPVYPPEVTAETGAIVDHLVAHRFLQDDHGMLSMGPAGESTFGRRHFMDLTSVFTTPPVFAVLAGRREIGQVPDLALYAAFQADGPAVLLLAGRTWKILEVDWNRRRLHVEPIDAKGRVRFAGTPRPLGSELCRSIGEVLAGESPGVTLSKRAATRLDEDHAELRIPPGGTLLHFEEDGRVEWWTFAGLRANLAMASALADLRRQRTSFDNLRISLDPGTSLDALRGCQTQPVGPVAPPKEVLEGLKFGDALPSDLAAAVVTARLEDPVAADLLRHAPILQRS
jgi:ATP-dependent Lhr-like helicase